MIYLSFKKKTKNLTGLAALLSNEEDVEDLFQRVDHPLAIASDPKAHGEKVCATTNNYEICTLQSC